MLSTHFIVSKSHTYSNRDANRGNCNAKCQVVKQIHSSSSIYLHLNFKNLSRRVEILRIKVTEKNV